MYLSLILGTSTYRYSPLKKEPMFILVAACGVRWAININYYTLAGVALPLETLQLEL